MASHYAETAEPTIWLMPDGLWADCRPLLPPEKPPGTRGRPVVPFRQVLDGILHVLRTGCQWKAVPREFGSGSTDVLSVASGIGYLNGRGGDDTLTGGLLADSLAPEASRA